MYKSEDWTLTKRWSVHETACHVSLIKKWTNEKLYQVKTHPEEAAHETVL